MIRCVFGDESVKKLNSISLSNNTIQRRIEEMSVDILQQVINDICRSENGFAIQLDESTDVTNCAQLLIFVRYVGKEGAKEEFLMNAALEATTKRDDIFQMVNFFFKFSSIFQAIFQATWFKMGKSKGLHNEWGPSYVRTKVWF